MLLFRYTDNDCCKATSDRSIHHHMWPHKLPRVWDMGGEREEGQQQKSMRGYVAALSITVFANSGNRYFSPGSTQPFQKASHQAHLALTQVVGFQAIPSPVRKSTSKLLVLQVAGHNSPQLHFFSLSATFLLTTFLFITSPSCLSFLTGRFSDRQAASHLYRQASLSQISNTAVIT